MPTPKKSKAKAAKAKTSAKVDPPRLSKEVSVMAWIENEFGELLMLKQKNGRKLWTLPGGKVSKGESLSDALTREVFEETGLKLKASEFLLIFDRPEKCSLTFLYRGIVSKTGTLKPCGREISEAEFRVRLPEQHTPSLAYFWAQMGI